MIKKFYLSSKNKNISTELLRSNSGKFITFKEINYKNIKSITLIAIDNPRKRDLFLPFREKILFRLEYNSVRKSPYSIFLFNLFFKTIYEWDSNYLNNSRSFLPFFPSRLGLIHEENIVREVTKINFFYSNNFVPKKNKILSTVTSSKATLEWQKQRIKLINFLKAEIKNIDHFGRGFNVIPEKSIALINYKYHIAIENCDLGPSEKLWDPLLCNCIVFYGGDCSLLLPDIKKAIIEIPIYDLNKTKKIIEEELSSSKILNQMTHKDWLDIKHRIKLNYTFSSRF